MIAPKSFTFRDINEGRVRRPQIAASGPPSSRYRLATLCAAWIALAILSACEQKGREDVQWERRSLTFNVDDPNHRRPARHGTADARQRGAARSDPQKMAATDAEGFYRRANAYADVLEFEAAIADYTAAIKLRRGYVEAYHNRACSFYDFGDYQQSIADSSEALKLKGDDPLTYYNRGLAHEKLAQLDEAIADYGESIRLKPDFGKAYDSRGSAYYAKGDWKQSLADSDAAVRLEPSWARAWYDRGVTHQELGRWDQATEDYSAAIRLSPEFVPPYVNRGELYRLSGETISGLDRQGCQRSRRSGSQGMRQSHRLPPR
jgi:tetratricopeptide (TPR) repeat protein